LGYGVSAAAELEFFFFEPPLDGKVSTRTSDDGSYFDLSPVDRGDTARRDISLALEAMGIRVEATHHEVSRGQHEIDLATGGALELADALLTARVVVKSISARHGLQATFMPKPLSDEDGSGLHIRQRLTNQDGNAFYDASAPMRLSDTALHYIAGLLEHARGFTAVTNPTINSYKRLVPGYDAPSFVSWARRAKSALVRVPEQRGADVSVELRSPDPSCNPYLALACIVRAGTDGIRRKLLAGDAIETNVAALSDDERSALGLVRLPASLEEAVEALDDDPLVQSAIGDHSYQHLRETKLAEWEAYRAQVHPWELRAYLNL
jgi:glutamine synthetase